MSSYFKMVKCNSFLHILILATLFCCTVATDSEDRFHFESCPTGHQYRSKCYTLGKESTYMSIRSCTLVRIESEEENDYIHEMMLEQNQSSVWIDGPKSYGAPYTNFRGSSYGYCYGMERQGKWSNYAYSSCRGMRKQPVCTSTLACQEGWIGKDCDKQCHCHEETCTRLQNLCTYGCQEGWTGDGCFEEASAPQIEHYCFKYKRGYTLTLSMVLTSQVKVFPLGQDGQPINPTEYTEVYSKDALLQTSTSDLSSPFEPNYHARKIDGSTFEWDLRIGKYEDVRLQADTDIRVRCNFSDVDEMYISTSLDFNTGFRETPAMTSSLPSYEFVGMFFTDPKNIDPLTNIRIGQPIKVTLLQQFVNVNNISAEDMTMERVYLSPRKCFATSPDKKIVRQLSDANGCPLQSDLFARFFKSWENGLATDNFPAFGLPGYSSMNISCSLVVCSSEGHYFCAQPCRYPVNSRLTRSVAEIKEDVDVIQEISASVNILR